MEAFLKANIIKGLTSNANYIFNFNNTAIKPVDCRQCIEIPREKKNKYFSPQQKSMKIQSRSELSTWQFS